MSLIIRGHRFEVPGYKVTSWLDDPKVAPPVTDGRPRATDPIALCFHTSRGQRGKLQPGARPSTRAELLARYQARTPRQVSWHTTGDTDGDLFQQADLALWMCWHVEEANGWTIGHESIQHPDSPDQWEVQIASEVAYAEVVCAELAIPRRVIVDSEGRPWMKPVPSLVMKKYEGPGGRWAGILGHCHLVPDTVRGPGDPGAHVFEALLRAGFEGVFVGDVH